MLITDKIQRPEWLRQRLEWFQDMKFGLFMHWGIYSQWGCIESWPLVEEDTWARADDLAPWVERGRDMERFKRDYFDLNKTFNPIHFNPAPWAQAAKYAGMKYIVFTTKHHDGFCMFDTRQTDFRVTAPDCPFSKDRRANIALEIFNAFRAEGFAAGVYFSKADWHCPFFWDPSAPARTRNPNYDTQAEPEKWGRFKAYVYNQIQELMTGYGPVDILWLDSSHVQPPRQDIDMDSIVRMARQHQPGLIVADRMVGGEHENYMTPEQEVPDRPLDVPWESCITMGDQWSYKADDRYKSARSLIHLLVDIVAKGGNLLLNIGPSPDGLLPPDSLERLKELGDWMQVNGEAIYSTRPVAPYKEGRIAYTRRGSAIYAVYLAEDGLPEEIMLPALRPRVGSEVYLLGWETPLKWRAEDGKAVVEIPQEARQSPPCRYAYAIKMTE